ncbi:unnamed protein product [Calypogeia fissa]
MGPTGHLFGPASAYPGPKSFASNESNEQKSCLESTNGTGGLESRPRLKAKKWRTEATTVAEAGRREGGKNAKTQLGRLDYGRLEWTTVGQEPGTAKTHQ